MKSDLFTYGFSVGGALDIGCVRDSNQDEIMLAESQGFFAVSDGMGGLTNGGDTSEMVARVMPQMVMQDAEELDVSDPDPKRAGILLKGAVQNVSDSIAEAANTDGFTGFGATFSGVWLIGTHAVFVNMGDSRAYMLDRYGRMLRQVSIDHNIAQLLVNNGEITREEARHHPASSQLTRFVGMEPPSMADVFIEEVCPGDHILLCSDGLYGEVEDEEIKSLMRSSRSPSVVCRRLVNVAKSAGGHDNIGIVYIKVGK